MGTSQNAHKRNKRKWLYQLKTGLFCQDCGESHVACLSFHHRNPANKFKAIPQMCSEGYSEARILDEIAKCDVLCANCHLKHHYKVSKYADHLPD